MAVLSYYCSVLLIIFSLDKTLSDCNFNTCTGCISSPECVWCSEDGLKPADRCKAITNITPSKSDVHPRTYNFKENKWCEERYLHDPPTFMNSTKNQEFTAKKSSSKEEVRVQLKPQVIEIQARPQQPVPFNISYQPADDYPLDIYMLMDTSYTMRKYVNDLKTQAQKIYIELSQYTNNVKLGLGSFIEKPAYPYYNPTAKDESYAFRSHVRLTDSLTVFEQAIERIKFGANLDDPEAGLDALMQVMTCEKKLNWRNKNSTRRIIVLCTDSTYHSAGDGKMIGIVKHNDMKCHVEGENDDLEYKTELEQDYPSVSQINKIATSENYIIIFVAAKSASEAYTALGKQISGAKYAEMKNESNVVEIIKNAYKEAIGNAKFRILDLPSEVKITLDPDCNTDKTEHCRSTPEHPIVTVKGTLTVEKCPTDGTRTKEIHIQPIGLSEMLTIKLTFQCSCNCGDDDVGSDKCSNKGTYRCGVCACDENRFGEDCSCNGALTDSESFKKCKSNATEDEDICSGRGICRCGICDCDQGLTGEFCELNDNACPKDPEGKLCFGNGICHHGQCDCKSGWTHPNDGTTIRDCSCSTQSEICISPRNKEICSGNGECICGACVCKKEEGLSYYGDHCDFERCHELEDYVLCNYQTNDKPSCDTKYNLTDIDVNVVDRFEINDRKWYKAKWCKKDLEDGNYIVFKYLYRDQTTVVAIQKEPELRPKPNMWVAIGSAIGAIILIGLLTLLLWKILVDILDKREYEKFSKEAAAMGLDVRTNILYESPVLNFRNPAYQDQLGEAIQRRARR